MKTFSAVALGCLLGVSILLLWIPDRWPASLLQVGIFALSAAWVIRMLFSPYRLETNVLLLPLAAAVLWGLLQLAINSTIYRWDTVNAVLDWATRFVVFFLALQIFSDLRLRDRFLRAAVAFGCILAVISTFQLATAQGWVFWLFDSGYRDTVMGPFVYQNQYAAFMELLLPLALLPAVTDDRRPVLYAAIAAAMYASVIASGSRAGFVLASTEILMVPLLTLFRHRQPAHRVIMLLVCVLALTTVFAWAVGWDFLWKRLSISDPFALRREYLHSSVDMVRAKPIMGFGLGTWSTAYPPYAYLDNGLFANQAHNDWAQWACEGGLPFLAMILSIALWSVRAGFRSLLGVGVVSVFLHSFVDYPVQRPALGVVFFVFLAILANHRNSAKNSLDVS